MGRYLLDTNILVFMISGDSESFSNEIKNILDDFSNQLNTSVFAVSELIQLYRIGKVKTKKYKSEAEIIEALEQEFYIKTLPFSFEHSKILAKLKIADGHNDPFDHAIISHAIAENLIAISSDRKFDFYTSQKLKFSFNKR